MPWWERHYDYFANTIVRLASSGWLSDFEMMSSMDPAFTQARGQSREGILKLSSEQWTVCYRIALLTSTKCQLGNHDVMSFACDTSLLFTGDLHNQRIFPILSAYGAVRQGNMSVLNDFVSWLCSASSWRPDQLKLNWVFSLGIIAWLKQWQYSIGTASNYLAWGTICHCVNSQWELNLEYKSLSMEKYNK